MAMNNINMKNNNDIRKYKRIQKHTKTAIHFNGCLMYIIKARKIFLWLAKVLGP